MLSSLSQFVLKCCGGFVFQSTSQQYNIKGPMVSQSKIRSQSVYCLGREHISQLWFSGLLWKVQCTQVHTLPPPPPPPPMGGKGEAPGPTNEP